MQTLQETYNMLMPHFSVVCDNRTTLCSVIKLRFRTTLTLTIHQLLVVVQTTLGQSLRVAMLCVHNLQLRCDRILGDCFRHELEANIVFRDRIDGVGANISGCVRPWFRLKSFRISLDFTRPSFSRSTHRV